MKNLNIACTFTDRESEAARIYLREIMHFPLTTKEEECELVKRIHEGDDTAVQRLVEGNLRFVVSVAKQYHGETLSLMDLVQEGNMGLMHAARHFGGENGASFITYAKPFVHEAIQLALSQKNEMVRRPLRTFRKESAVRQFVSRYEQEHCQQPSAKEVAEATGMDEHDVVSILYRLTTFKSLDSPSASGSRGDDDERSAEESLKIISHSMPTAVQTIDHKELAEALDEVLGQLNENERTLLQLYYGLGEREPTDMAEIASRLGIGLQWAYKLYDRALRNISNRPSLLARLQVFANK